MDAAWTVVTQVWSALCAHPIAILLTGTALALLYMDLSHRLPLRGLPGTKTGFTWPVIGDLPACIAMMRDGTHEDLLREDTVRNDFRTWAGWTPFANEIVLSDPANLRHMFTTNFQGYQLPQLRKECFAEALGSGIFNSDGPRWKDQRNFASHLFSATQLRRRMRDVFEAHARRVRRVLEDLPPGEVIDMQRLMYSYTFDSICEIAFGLPVNSLGGNEADSEFQRAFDAVQCRATVRCYEPGWQILRALGLGAERTLADNVAVVDGYINRILAARDQGDAPSGDSSSSDLLSIYEEHCSETGRKADRAEMRDLIMNFMIAGRDTTACVLTWTFWELSRNPEAVFQEVLRLHPSVPIDEKECVRDDVLPDGTKVRKGTLVHFSPCLITRNPKFYPEPNSFLPSRWLDESGRCRKYDEYSYPCFNAGPRICLGRHMAPLEAKVLLSELMDSLRVDIVPGFEPRLLAHPVLMTRNGMPASVTKRAETA